MASWDANVETKGFVEQFSMCENCSGCKDEIDRRIGQSARGCLMALCQPN